MRPVLGGLLLRDVLSGFRLELGVAQDPLNRDDVLLDLRGTSDKPILA
jgi:hypothetical protein